MEKSLKIVILLSIPIIIVTAVVVAAMYAPSAYVQQCKHQVGQLVDDLYKTAGGKAKFMKSFQNQNLTDDAQSTLQKITNISNQCPELGSFSISNFDSFNNLHGNLSKQAYQA